MPTTPGEQPDGGRDPDGHYLPQAAAFDDTRAVPTGRPAELLGGVQ
ncbi:hypothetical protein AB0K53_21495 [Streptomyces tuirus]